MNLQQIKQLADKNRRKSKAIATVYKEVNEERKTLLEELKTKYRADEMANVEVKIVHPNFRVRSRFVEMGTSKDGVISSRKGQTILAHSEKEEINIKRGEVETYKNKKGVELFKQPVIHSAYIKDWIVTFNNRSAKTRIWFVENRPKGKKKK